MHSEPHNAGGKVQISHRSHRPIVSAALITLTRNTFVALDGSGETTGEPLLRVIDHRGDHVGLIGPRNGGSDSQLGFGSSQAVLQQTRIDGSLDHLDFNASRGPRSRHSRRWIERQIAEGEAPVIGLQNPIGVGVDQPSGLNSADGRKLLERV